MSKRIKKTALHIVHAATNPVGFTMNGGLRKFAQDAQSGGGVLSPKMARTVGQYAPIALAFIPGVGPLVAAGATAANNYANTGKLGASLLKGGLSYAGGQLGSSIGAASSLGGQTLGGALGEASNSITNAAQALGGSTLGAGVSNYLGQGLGNLLGGYAGSQLGENVAESLSSSLSGPPDMTNFQPYKPHQDSQSELPSSLQGFGSLNPTQQSSNIANQGVYGGGLGPDEQKYFTNLINRRLVDPNGNVNNLSSLNPIESSYLQKLGLGGYGNSNDLLEAISKWQAAA